MRCGDGRPNPDPEEGNSGRAKSHASCIMVHEVGPKAETMGYGEVSLSPGPEKHDSERGKSHDPYNMVREGVKPTVSRESNRIRQVGYGKATPGYAAYSDFVPKWGRRPGEPNHPHTPPTSPTLPCRQWCAMYRDGRRALHSWDTVATHTHTRGFAC